MTPDTDPTRPRDRFSDYIGDGVYAEFDGYHIWLWADRDGQRHRIALEPAVLAALNRYAERLRVVPPVP